MTVHPAERSEAFMELGDVKPLSAEVESAFLDFDVQRLLQSNDIFEHVVQGPEQISEEGAFQRVLYLPGLPRILLRL